jgi:cyclic beta-1,2-glucan synthetase
MKELSPMRNRRSVKRPAAVPPWDAISPIREELFSVERLEQHALSLAADQTVTRAPRRVLPLTTRLRENAGVLLSAYRASAATLEAGHPIVPAAEWLLDNYHVVEAQIDEIRSDLPPGYYRQLPKLQDGPFAGYPRVFGIAWAFVAHTDSYFDSEMLRRFVQAYQQVQVLTIGELWATAITLRIVLVENLRRLAVQIRDGHKIRMSADALADRLLGTATTPAEPVMSVLGHLEHAPIDELLAAQLAKRLRNLDPVVTPAHAWLDLRLEQQGTSIEEVVAHAQQRQGASNVSVRNVITSMRALSELDWAAWIESVSAVDGVLRQDVTFAAMDFQTRNLYRSAIEDLARGSVLDEVDVARRAVARAAHINDDNPAARDTGYHLIAGGRRAFEDEIGFRPTWSAWPARLSVKWGLKGYLAALTLAGLLLLALALYAVNGPAISVYTLLALAIAGILPAWDAATTLVNRAVTMILGATTLPALELDEGVPEHLRTLVVVPALLGSEADIFEQIERLEVHYLASASGALSFALLTDWVDAGTPTCPQDETLLATAQAGIARLNDTYTPEGEKPRFFLLHRRRVFNPAEGKWMGWERKRGKLHELNRLLRGRTDTTFITPTHQLPENVRYVITLDSDTRLPRDCVRRLIGKMAHPLNRPRFDMEGRRVIDGYGIMQPRVTPSLPMGKEGSFYQRVYSAPGGLDAYAAAVSDVYQDLFGEGSFTGKGIYDIDAFEQTLDGRVPENALLSHDLFEGTYARAGLASDVEVVEEFPARFDVSAKRQHRWARGDWQLLPWMMRRGEVPAVGRWKMVDNLRRSLSALFTFLALVIGWTLPPTAALIWMCIILGTIALPSFLPLLFALLPRNARTTPSSHMRALFKDLRMAASQTALNIAFAAAQAWLMGDAVVRTLYRLYISHKHLLEWTTAAQSQVRPQPGIAGYYAQMAGPVILSALAALLVLIVSPVSLIVASPVLVAWLAAPALAFWVSVPVKATAALALSAGEESTLRLIARKTWRYFETFVTAADHYLPPDNFQNDPKPVLARRTSPTNIGLYLLSTVAARDFGWSGLLATLERLEDTLATLGTLDTYRGHFYNWYGTADLRVLDPPYVSSVDSGNLAGHLIALSNACKEWAQTALSPDDLRQGIADNVLMARAALAALPITDHPARRSLAALFGEMESVLSQRPDSVLKRIPTLTLPFSKGGNSVEPAATVSPPFEKGRVRVGILLSNPEILSTLLPLTIRATALSDAITGETGEVASADLVFWVGAIERCVREHHFDSEQMQHTGHGLDTRLDTIARTARDMAMNMDFAFLLEPDRKLLSIGYSIPDSRLDNNCYDLLASEARLASLFAIAKGDVPVKHWFRLGRSSTPLGSESGLISWSGSMFEYLMPSLVMRAPAGSLLEQTNRLVVARQQEYGHALGTPWGISESAYNARDMEFTYQYSNFGVPGLGLKRGLAENTVIAPYASGLAAMVDPRGALTNYAVLASMGGSGRFGFYEALDFTPSRVPEGQKVAVVRNFMAHHQGMTIVAIANTLQNARMRRRFHAEPIIQATELLLQERVPRDVAVAHPRAEEVKTATANLEPDVPTVRQLGLPHEMSPVTHLLSNGRYAVMLTSAGSGYSRWGDIHVSRWREDATRDDWGAYIFVRDTENGKVWSSSYQPTAVIPDSYNVTFSEDRAEIVRHDSAITTSSEIIVSSEDDAEVRRVSLVNCGLETRCLELTSYAELVLADAASDSAHPAFSKMFVQTEFLAERGAILATRRRRSPHEPEVWAAHLAVVEGTTEGEIEIETDRARFIGRGWSTGTAAALSGAALSGTVGTVLDPVFALRRRVVIAPGQTARVAFWTMVASSREELLDIIDKHQDASAYERALTLSWTQAQVQLRHLDMKTAEAADFQSLAAHIIFADLRLRPAPDVIARGAGPQSGLWPHGISGDIPIIIMRIDDIQDIAAVRQLLRAHEYWRIKKLPVDLVIINERSSSYVQDLQIAIETAVRSSQSRPRFDKQPVRGEAFTLRADLMTSEARDYLGSVARIVMSARRGGVSDQLARLADSSCVPAFHPLPISEPEHFPAPEGLEFFNGTGGFADNGREYVVVLDNYRTTPAPWINVIANAGFGFQTSADGSGYTWAVNSRDHQITPWSNDAVTDPAGECFYVRDEKTGELFGPTAQPIRDGGTYIARHGRGYSAFEHSASGIAMVLTQYVPLEDPIKISRLVLTNNSGRTRTLSVTAYAEWVLGTARGAAAPFIITHADTETGALFASNPWGAAAFGPRVAFMDMSGHQASVSGDRRAFIGRNRSLSAPEALLGTDALPGKTGAGLDPCAAMQTRITLAPGASVEIVTFLGECASEDEARALVGKYREMGGIGVLNDPHPNPPLFKGRESGRACDQPMEKTSRAELSLPSAEGNPLPLKRGGLGWGSMMKPHQNYYNLDSLLQDIKHYWDDLLDAVQVKTPDRSMDIMLNGWLLYQTLACRVIARSAFYQASGAYGFRDQIQDGMALTFSRPELTRGHLVRAAGRQFRQGDVQHWWLPHSGQGVRTRISDDRVWLVFGVATYIETTGDTSILDEEIAFIEGRNLHPGEHDAFYQPDTSSESGSLFEHCARGLDQCMELTGQLGLPLIGTGDWNDGMNRVGEKGMGESVWLGWLLIRAVDMFTPMVDARDPARAKAWRHHAAAVRDAIEREAWDGEWYRRGTFDDGTFLGSAHSGECKIDSIAQSWAVLSGAAEPGRARQAMASVDRHLVRRDDRLALLFTPPFDKTAHDPGYIKGYPPGLRENGGQYTHAAMWAIMAFAKLGQGDKASDLFSLLNPVNHASSATGVNRYKVEPYVVAADVYSVEPHAGRGGWTWYTGSAGWMYRAGLESILGIRKKGNMLLIQPCLPTGWPGFEAHVKSGGARCHIVVDNQSRAATGIVSARLNGEVLGVTDQGIEVPLEPGEHEIMIMC